LGRSWRWRRPARRQRRQEKSGSTRGGGCREIDDRGKGKKRRGQDGEDKMRNRKLGDI
jgi:hypothetical protein